MDLSYNFRRALDEVSANSSGGAPFLFCYGATFLVSAVLALVLSRPAAALVAMFQGAVALPLAFLLERRLAKGKMEKANPLHSLSALLAMSQALTLPALIAAYSMNPGSVPVVLAAIGGGHFLPYAWLHRTRIYSIFAFTVSFGGFAIQLAFPQFAFPASCSSWQLFIWRPLRSRCGTRANCSRLWCKVEDL